MIILWVRKRKSDEPKDFARNDKESFQKHDEIMKQFRFSHPDLDVKIITPKDILSTDGNLLVKVNTVKLGDNKQN